MRSGRASGSSGFIRPVQRFPAVTIDNVLTLTHLKIAVTAVIAGHGDETEHSTAAMFSSTSVMVEAA